MFFFSQASAVGLNIGVSGVTAVFHAEGQENENGEKSTEDATGVAGYTSLFVEKTLGDRLAIGVDYNPSAMSSETANNDRLDKTTAASASSVTNSVKVDFEDWHVENAKRKTWRQHLVLIWLCFARCSKG